MSWKKTLAFIGVFIALLTTPLVLVSNPMMDVYQERIDKEPKTSFNRWLQLKTASICYKTMRPERSADGYRKFMTNFPDDPEYPHAWLRYAQSLEECHKNAEAEEQYVLMYEVWEEKPEWAELREEARRGILRVRYQKRK